MQQVSIAYLQSVATAYENLIYVCVHSSISDMATQGLLSNFVANEIRSGLKKPKGQALSEKDLIVGIKMI